VSNPCGVVHISATGTLDGPQGWPAQTRQVNFAAAFPFVVTPPSIDPNPLFTRTAVEANQCAKPKPKTQTQRAEAPPTYTPPPPPPPSYDSAPSQPYTPGPAGPSATPVTTTDDAPPERWSGLYVGVVAGAAWQQSNPFLDCSDYTNPDPSVCSTAASFLIPGNAFSLNDTGFLGGGQIGYNFSIGNIVLGFEADMAYTSIDTTSSFDQVFPFGCCTIVRGSFMHQELSSLSTVRGRVGYAFDNILLYATGGLALGQVEYVFELNWPDIDGFARGESSKLAVGYTGGAGIEIALGKWSLKTEYLFYDLGNESLAAPFLINGAAEPFTFRPEFTTLGHIFRVGTNFSLN
jgi:outer membrane immunogenic protein